MFKKLLKNYKGKIVAVGTICSSYLLGDSPSPSENYFRLLDFDDNFLSLQTWTKNTFIIPISNVSSIEKDDPEAEKFLRWEKEIEKDPKFIPEEIKKIIDEDKGYKIIKRRSENGN